MNYNDNGNIKQITVKAGDTLPVGTIVEFDGTTIPAGYEAVEEEKDIYSLEEVKTNKVWIDGKPIYRKVIEGATDESGGIVISTIVNVSKLINIYGFIQSATGHQFLPNSSMGIDGTNDIRVIKTSKNNIQIQFGSYFYNCTYNFVLEYTKTID